jgi:hypothetical protein
MRYEMMCKVKEVVFRFSFGGRAFIESFGICLDTDKGGEIREKQGETKETGWDR